MKKTAALIAALALLPSLAMAGHRHWGHKHRQHRNHYHAGYSQGYCAPAPVVYVAPRPRHVHVSHPAVVLGLAAGITTAILVNELAYQR